MRTLQGVIALMSLKLKIMLKNITFLKVALLLKKSSISECTFKETFKEEKVCIHNSERMKLKYSLMNLYFCN